MQTGQKNQKWNAKKRQKVTSKASPMVPGVAQAVPPKPPAMHYMIFSEITTSLLAVYCNLKCFMSPNPKPPTLYDLPRNYHGHL